MATVEVYDMDQKTNNNQIASPGSADADDKLQIHSQEFGLEKQQEGRNPPSPPTGPPPSLPSCACSVCDGEGLLHSRELHVIDAAAARGCHWCSMFSQAIRRAYPPSQFKDDHEFIFDSGGSYLYPSPHGAYHNIKLGLVNGKVMQPYSHI